jgi:hypothetical protein
MAAFLRRWRAPVLVGIAIWSLSVPLLTKHQAGLSLLQAGLATGSPDPDDSRPLVHTVRLASGPPAASPSVTPSVVQLATSPVPVLQTMVGTSSTARAASSIGANRIVIPRLGLNQPVGWYRDCMGAAPVPRSGTWRWSCAGANNTYILAHNPGVFTPILVLHVGDLIEYGDPSGRAHTYRVTFTTIVANTQLWPTYATAVPSLTLQTCWTWDGSRDFIVRAVQI